MFCPGEILCDSAVYHNIQSRMASLEVDGKTIEVQDGSSTKEALEAAGMEITTLPSSEGHFMPCQTGGCCACAVDVDGKLQPACGLKSFSEDRTEKGHLLCHPAAAEPFDFFLR